MTLLPRSFAEPSAGRFPGLGACDDGPVLLTGIVVDGTGSLAAVRLLHNMLVPELLGTVPTSPVVALPELLHARLNNNSSCIA